MVHRMHPLAPLTPSAILTAMCLTLAAAEPDPPLHALLPQPSRLEWRTGSFALGAGTPIVAHSSLRASALQLADSLRLATSLALTVTEAEAGRPAIVLERDPTLDPRLGKEGYLLSVAPNQVRLRAATEAGLFYAGITLRQLLPARLVSARAPAESAADLGCSLPAVEIEDRPGFGWRGLLLDPARHFLPVEFVKRFIDLMALHKLNTLQLHLTDDQGWRLEIRRYPRLTSVGSVRHESPKRGDRNAGDGTPYGPFFYTQAQVRELVAYAAARHVTLVPEIEMPGHFRAALAAYPEFSCTGGPFEVRTRWGVEPDILCAGNDRALEFVEAILTEVIELFPGAFIHTGGDEAPKDRWKDCPKCQARIRALGLKDEAELQSHFTARLSRFLADRGRRLIGWDEILEGGLAPGAAVMSWRGWEGGIAAANLGHDVVMSPTTHCYFDYAQAQGPGEPEAIGGFIPLAKVYGFDPIPQAVDAARARHILGAQGNIWSEYLFEPRDVEYFAFPRAIALAEVLWSHPDSRDHPGFLRRLAVHLERLDALNVNYRRLDPLP
jgi:hexosaminidase